MSLSKAYGFASGHFTDHSDDYAGYAAWCESLHSESCAACDRAPARDLSGLCLGCEVDELAAIERDLSAA